MSRTGRGFGFAAMLVPCLCLGALAATAAAAAPPTCSVASLSALKVPHVTITVATDKPAEAGAPDYCEVIGAVATDGEGAGPNEAGFELKLPGLWNGKFLFWGVGGFAGSFTAAANPVDQAAALIKGYATIVTDGGHRAKAFDGAWALLDKGKPDKAKLADYFYRAAHQVTVAGKRFVQRYYGAKSIRRAYFDGCSNGGRMALMEAMRYPEDYDGVIAGAPYLDIAGTNLACYNRATAFLHAYIDPSLLPAIDKAIDESCDAADGVADGLVQNPAKCSFDPASLVCQKVTDKNCLSPAQADAMKRYFSAVTDARGEPLDPGPGIADFSTTAAHWSLTGLPDHPDGPVPWSENPPLCWSAADATIRDFVALDAKFNSNRDWEERDGRVSLTAQKAISERLHDGAADQPERLAAFFAGGRKLLLYHGYADSAISPYRTIQFYEALAKRRGGYAKLRRQAALFMVPGMGHCGGGPGPNSFDTLTALEEWVEQGKAPQALLARHYAGNQRDKPVERTMPLCRFPAEAQYDGTGDVRDAAHWRCTDNAKLLETGPNGLLAGLGAAPP